MKEENNFERKFFVGSPKIATSLSTLRTAVMLYVDVTHPSSCHITTATLALPPCTNYSTVRRYFRDEMMVFCKDAKNRRCVANFERS